MRILLISSSPRKEKSQTFLLAKQVLESCVEEGAETETVHLRNLKLEFCQHCEACHIKIMQCPIKDDAAAVIKKMLDADGIVFATPNYINQITASMKTLFERTSHFIHCKRLLGKYIAAVAVSGSGYDEPVLNYIKYCGHTCGAQYAGGVSCRAPLTDPKKKEAGELGKTLVNAIKEKRIFPEQIKTIEAGKAQFREVMEQRKDLWLEEYQYWQNQGWL